MAKEEKHPHSENPSLENIAMEMENIYPGHDPELKKAYISIHRMIVEVLPGLNYSMDLKDGQIGYGARQYGYDGWGMAALALHKKWINLHFMKGADLDQQVQNDMLEGKGKQLRHMKFTSADEVEQKAKELRELLMKASTICRT